MSKKKQLLDLEQNGYDISISINRDITLRVDPSYMLNINHTNVTIQGKQFSTNEILVDDCISISNSPNQKIIILRKGTKSWLHIIKLTDKLYKTRHTDAMDLSIFNEWLYGQVIL